MTTPTPSQPVSSPAPSPSLSPSRPSSPAPSSAAPAVLAARYTTSASWETGFIGTVSVTNTGTAEASWSVDVTYPADAGVRITSTWNAQLTGATFSGGTLAPGATATFGFSANKQVRARVAPSGCSIAGTPCKIG
ncbi:cellulose binding domain-containing protein [Actinoplanes sp. NPDC051494]|uniref:cellulose binding domain-containing protein n=1 Tax=Actinoplanes sp. NPDC051494 TaxID=3363907 RepID=UPI0037AED3A2